ncbi:muconolactone Delta-isomerase family protein [Caballeronia sp. dw_19]|uniref:muconolactone Delta-isomerase family protein n=1 Tax=unclassified Caballeronia TaxID=2646786 RepID=UPI001BD4976E|nr:muconolactone Delta-isomerase family protein [Caballeronia sp. dw_19]
MLYLVHMQVVIPAGTNPAELERLQAAEKTFSQRLQTEGKWRHLWRVTGEFANYSVFDVESHDELHTLLTALPLYRFMTSVHVTPLAQHPSALVVN